VIDIHLPQIKFLIQIVLSQSFSMSVESVRSEFHFIKEGEMNRKIAYSCMGHIDAKHIFLCLPGLLETRDSFHHLLSMVESFADCCWISIDYCGRGESDPLPLHTKYSFSQYLADTEDVMASLILHQRTHTNRKFHLIGTSMGGILAMHLAHRFQHRVDSVVLNDIGLFLHWSSLMNLYQNIQESDTHLSKLRVDARVVDAVLSRSHFDLPYEFDLFGMRFSSLLDNFHGKVVLLHNSESPICPSNIANQSKTKYANLKIWSVDQQGHPAKWDDSAVMKLTQLMRLKPKSVDHAHQNLTVNSPEIAQEENIFNFNFIHAFLKTSQTYLESSTDAPRHWLSRMVSRFKFWKRSYS